MNKLPTGWKRQTLEDVAEVIMGQSPPGSSYNESGKGTPFFQGKAEFGEVYPTVKKYTTAGTKFANRGDILMSVRAPVGPTNIAEINCVIGRGLAAIRAKDSITQDYLKWTLKHLEVEIQGKGKGTTFDSISGNALRETIVVLPPIAEQHQIVEILEDHLSRLDAALADVKQARVKAAQFRRSYIHEMTSNIKGALLAPLLEVCNVYQPKTISTKELNPDGKFPVYGANGQIGFYNEYNHEESEVTVTCRGATCGTVNVIPDHAWITGNAMVFHPKDERLNKGFLEYVLRGFDFSRVITGTAQPQITRASLQDLMLPLVSIEMQHSVAETLDNSLSRVEKANNLAQDALLQGLSLRRSLLQSAFTGQLTREVTHV